MGEICISARSGCTPFPLWFAPSNGAAGARGLETAPLVRDLPWGGGQINVPLKQDRPRLSLLPCAGRRRTQRKLIRCIIRPHERTAPMTDGIRLLAPPPKGAETILSQKALALVEKLHRQFQPARQTLLKRRTERQAEFDAGALPEFLPETETVRKGDWKVAATPADLQQRWVEITGPVERKMMINALNSGADVFMADFEDSLSPTWSNVVLGQANLIDAVR